MSVLATSSSGVVVVGAVLTVAGIVIVVVAVLGWRGRLPRQHWAGIRVASTMRSDATWKAAHRVAGPWFLAAGLGAAAGGLVLLVVRPDQPEQLRNIALGATVLLLVPGAVGTILGIRAANAAHPTP